MFGFDPTSALFDITPVDNAFITEYLPQAKDGYTKVYLYGLMRCYHPEEEMNLDRMSHELSMPMDEILKAYRYWERHGLVRRISDNPPRWVYIHTYQRSLSMDVYHDSDYQAFSDAVCDALSNGRMLSGSEIQTCYEWVEDLQFDTEVVIMLLKYMTAAKGKNFSIHSADHMAAEMAEAGVHTADDAEEFFARDQQIIDGTRAVLRKLGKRGLPTDSQLNMYRKWRDEWHFDPQAIMEACDLTAKGEPSMGYLEGILVNVRAMHPDATRITSEMLNDSQQKGDRLKKILRILGDSDLTAEKKAILEEIEAMYTDDIVEIAANECAKRGLMLPDVKRLLFSWYENGLRTLYDVESYLNAFHSQNDLLKQLNELWGGEEPHIGDTNRQRIARWIQLGFTPEMILKTACYASEAKAPMAYLDKILETYAQQGIHTPEEAEKAQRRFRESRHSGSSPSSPSNEELYNTNEEIRRMMDQYLQTYGKND